MSKSYNHHLQVQAQSNMYTCNCYIHKNIYICMWNIWKLIWSILIIDIYVHIHKHFVYTNTYIYAYVYWESTRFSWCPDELYIDKCLLIQVRNQIFKTRVNICVYIYAYVYIYTYRYLYVNGINMYVGIYICLSTFEYACLELQTHTSMRTCI